MHAIDYIVFGGLFAVPTLIAGVMTYMARQHRTRILSRHNDTIVLSGWEDFSAPSLFLDDDAGGWAVCAEGQRRLVFLDGKRQWQRRARETTTQEWLDGQL